MNDQVQPQQEKEQVDGYGGDQATPPPVRPDFWIGDHVEIARKLIAQVTKQYHRAPVFDAGSLWRYDSKSGVWVKILPDELSQRVQQFSGKTVAGLKGPRPLKLRHPDISGIVKTAYAQVARPDYFAKATDGLAFKNGFLRVTRDKLDLLAHSASHRALMALPMRYEPDAAAPQFERFLDDLFRDDADRLEKIAVIQEFAGACLLGVAPRYQAALVLVGAGANGKSTLLLIILDIFPKQWRASLAPYTWGGEYNRSLLPGIRINAVNELPSRDLLCTDLFKCIISGDEIQARVIKNQPFTFKPCAGHVFATNSLPGITDESHGLWRRLIVVPFNRRFEEQEMVRDLDRKIIAKERAGIVNWMLVGAQRMLRNESYTIPPSSNAEKDLWKKQCDNVASFIEDMVEVVGETRERAGQSFKELGFSRAGEAYTSYRSYCGRNGFQPCSSRKFAARMKQSGLGSREDRVGNWYPIKIRDRQWGNAE